MEGNNCFKNILQEKVLDAGTQIVDFNNGAKFYSSFNIFHISSSLLMLQLKCEEDLRAANREQVKM